MASQPYPPKPTPKAQRFIEANQEARLVYQSTNGTGCFFRLEDDRKFELTTTDCLSMTHYFPRWRHLAA